MTVKKMMKVKLIRSLHGRTKGHKSCVLGLGLRRIHQTVSVEDTPSTRGMVNKVPYLVQIVEEV
ncbi:MAG: 50S ribosomal protein L30 [Pseudomonadota bacterium]